MFVRNERSIKEFIKFYPVVSTIVIINIVIWALAHLLHLRIGASIYSWGIGSNINVLLGEYWRLVTPIFLHADFSHVAFNSFAIVIFAPALEQMMGKIKFILFYFLTGVIGNIGTFIINPHDSTLHLGASGAIYGLFGIYIFMVYFRKSLIDSGSAQIVTIVFIVGLVFSFIQPNINIAAHLFGFIGGLALGPPFLKSAERFSMARNYAQHYEEGEVKFKPNRWKNRRGEPKRSFKTAGNRWKSIIWFIFIVLVMIGFISRFLLP